MTSDLSLGQQLALPTVHPPHAARAGTQVPARSGYIKWCKEGFSPGPIIFKNVPTWGKNVHE